jgi:hypothetical protein
MNIKTILFSLAFVLFNIIVASAQDFEVAPVVMKFEVEPGNIETRKLTIKNHSSHRQSYQLSLGDFQVLENGSKRSVKAGSTENSIIDWVTINPSFLDLNPNESAEVEVIMQVPTNRNETKWGFIYVQAIKEQAVGEGDKSLSAGVNVLPRINVVLTQSPKSNKSFAGKIKGLTEIEQKNETKRYAVTVENVGGKIIAGVVNFTLANLSTATENKFSKQQVTLYPGQKQVLEFDLPSNIAPGRYALAAIFDFGSKSALEGTQLMIEIP